MYEADVKNIFRISVPDFTSVSISPLEFVCEPVQDLSWTPDGSQIVYSGSFPIDHPLHPSNYGFDNSALYIMDRDGGNNRPINFDTAYGRWPYFAGWLDDTTLVYKYYAGGGHDFVTKLDIRSGLRSSETLIHMGSGYEPGLNYIAVNNGMWQDEAITAVAISEFSIHSDPAFSEGQFMICLSNFCGALPCVQSPCLKDNSLFEDWLPGSNSMLVLTWESGTHLTNEDQETINRYVDTKLQLWDVDTQAVASVVNGGIFGRFSPDGQFLAFHTLSPEPQLHLFEMASSRVILSLPSAEPRLKWSGEVFFWSPHNNRLIYQDDQGNWNILTAPDGNLIPLTINGGARLSRPQWSYDGRYLSFSVRDEDEGGTAVILAPNR